MKTLSIISYVIGGILLLVSCFTTSVAATWWLGGIAVAALIVGCVAQFRYKKNEVNDMIGTHHNF